MTRQIDPWAQLIAQQIEKLKGDAFSYRSILAHIRNAIHNVDAPPTLSSRRVMEKLIENAVIEEVSIKSYDTGKSSQGKSYDDFVRYSVGKVNPYSIALSLRSNSYFSHASAIFLLGLTAEIPKMIYINKEQSPKKKSEITTQAAIDKAFASNPRSSNYVFEHDGFRFVLLNGKHTGRLEVTEVQTPTGEFYPVTKVERTLVDSVVRPVYSGGIFHVREAFSAAKDRISINVLVATLKQLDYVYPYHQALGFLLENVGVPQHKLQRLKELGLDYDFYLVNKISNPQYNKSWRIYYPEGF